jgi:hypothetical protein
MPDTQNSHTPESDSKAVAHNGGNSPSGPTQEQHFMATAMQIMNANSYTPTQAQVDKMLALQEKSMDYVHHERTHFSPKLISTLLILVGIAIVFVGIFVFCVFYAPQYASQIISGFLGLVTGGVGGYGLGSKKTKNHHHDE